MAIPFFDANPKIVGQLREMDHSTREYKKYLRKVFLEMGGVVFLFKALKETPGGDKIRKKYIRNLITAGAFIFSMFVWIFVAYLLIGGREPHQFTETDKFIFINFIIFEIASVILSILFAFSSRRIIYEGVSFLIDNYNFEADAANENTLNNYKFQTAKANKLSILVAVIIFAATFLISSLSSGALSRLFVSDKEYSKAGITITLTDDFYEKEVVSQTAAYFSDKYFVMCLKEEINVLEQYGIYVASLKEYADIVIDNNLLDVSVQGTDSRPYFVYENQSNGKDFTYLAVLFKGSDAFWMVTFGCETKNYASAEEIFFKWADTVEISQ